jgi:hypothetical protein
MNIEWVKSSLKQLCLVLALVGVVLLLTLLFNILGTLSCAALVGMMLGGIRHRRVLALIISLVFPGVLFILMHLSKIELEGQKQVAVPVLSFGCFWMMYVMTCLMMGAEGKMAKLHPSSAAGRGAAMAGENRSGLPTVSDADAAMGELRLEQLQGRWNCESVGLDGQVQKKVIEITGDRLVLNGFDPDGQQCLHIESAIRCEDADEVNALVVAAVHPQSSTDTSSKKAKTI